MHQAVYHLAVVWLCALLAAAVVGLLRARSPHSRIVALDTGVLLVVALLVLFSAANAVPHFLDAALALGLLSFAATIAAARFTSGRRLFP